MNRLQMFNCMVLMAIVLGCQPEEPECIPSGKTKVVEVEKTPLPKSELNKLRDKQDYCKACARSPKGFFTCQTAYGKEGEPRKSLQQRARLDACSDAGYTPDTCPANAIVLQQCKGDEKDVKPTALSNALQDLLRQRTGRVKEPVSSSQTQHTEKSVGAAATVTAGTAETPAAAE
ncbi:MAG: hypothetical protein JXX29_00110 [Deltaproteobacteria bacterium]|nr:hypothetical protein [Deltaproteobacteria bacterium]MBN2670038.1 hypothetical protein [Deltaproteobacteria bacterium]